MRHSTRLAPTLRSLVLTAGTLALSLQGSLAMGLTAPQGSLAPPRGTIGPSPGDAARGGPGDQGTQATPGSASWTRWWAFNRDGFLGAVRAIGGDPLAPRPLDGSAAPLPGFAARPDDRTLYLEVVPTILGLLEKTRDLDIQAASLLALAKIGEAPRDLAKAEDLESVTAAILGQLKNKNQSVGDIALLSLGILGNAQQAPLLASVAEDDKEGRKALGTRSIDRRSRSFAAYGLANIGHRTSREAERTFVALSLARLAAAEKGDADLVTAAVIGIGLNPLPLATPAEPEEKPRGREGQIELLLELFDDPKTDDRGRAHIPVAAARLVTWPHLGTAPDHALALEARRAEVIERLVERLAKTKDARLREGCVQALGLAVQHAEAGADKVGREALLKFVKKTSGSQERESGLALIALARIAGRAPVKADRLVLDLRAAIGEQVSSGTPNRRGWATLALGILGFERRGRGADPALGTEALMRRALTGGKSPEERASAALALGLSGAIDDVAGLVKGLDQGDFRIRGLHALALALMPAPEAMPALQKIVRDRTYRPYLLRDVATALALLGDASLVQTLVGRLVSARFMQERLAALQALAWVNDAGSVPALLAYVTRKRIAGRNIDDTTRAFAIAALGAISSKEPLQWNAKFAAELTWNAAPPSLSDEEDGGGIVDVF